MRKRTLTCVLVVLGIAGPRMAVAQEKPAETNSAPALQAARKPAVYPSVINFDGPSSVTTAPQNKPVATNSAPALQAARKPTVYPSVINFDGPSSVTTAPQNKAVATNPAPAQQQKPLANADVVGMVEAGLGTSSRIVTFDSKFVISRHRDIAVHERVEIANDDGFFDGGFHRRLRVKPASRERSKAGSFESVRANVDGRDAQIHTVQENDILDIGIGTDGQRWPRGNHVIDLSYTAKNQFAVYSNFEDLNQDISGEWPVPIEKAAVELEFSGGMPPRTGISADTGTAESFRFDCVRTNLPSGVRFETSHPIPPNQRLFISARFMGRGYFASPDENESGISAFVVNYPLLSVLIVGFLVLTAIAYALAPAEVPGYNGAPRWIRTVVVATLPGTVALVLRLVYEQTLMTWLNGEQMVGFSLVHAYLFLYIPMLLSVSLAHVGVLCVLSVTVARRLKGLPTPKWNWLPFAALCVCIGLMYVPYEVWMATTIRLLGPGNHGTSFLMMAAADGKLPLAKALVEKGVSANAMAGGSTALDVACSSRSVEVAKFLLARGADISRAPNCANVSGLKPD